MASRTQAQSSNQGHGHLDATGDREVVYCHACAHEWYRDESGLICPHCQGEIIEIVSPGNDPRDIGPDLNHNDSTSTSSEMPGLRYPDSDPDEADIEEHMRGDNGFVYNRNTRPGVRGDHHQPGMDPVIHQFIDMVNNFGPSGAQPEPPRDPWRNPPGRAPAHPLGHHHSFHDDDDDDFYHPFHGHNRLHHPPANFGGPTRVHRTTFSNSPFGGGTASLTIYSGPIQMRNRGGQGNPGGEGAEGHDAFQRIFANVLRDMGGPEAEGDGPGHNPGHPPNFMTSLQDILGLLNPENARAGDAVYSQEALDRIISNLMEANPTSNAAPPASEEGLKKLERKPVDKAMLDGQDKTECSICIDDISEGDMALFLPCKHWFHEQCVVLWLKEHNTCPICRTPIETREARRDARQARMNNQNDSNSNAGGGASGGAAPSPSPMQPPLSGRRTWFPMQRPDNMEDADPSSPQNRRTIDEQQPIHPTQSARPPSHRHTRLNEALRSVSAMQERHRGGNEQGSSSGVSYDTSRMQRRSSLSPTSPRTTTPGYASHRQRSPSQSSGRWAASDRGSTGSGSQRQSGSGPLSWLRNRLPGGGSNNGSSRDGRPS